MDAAQTGHFADAAFLAVALGRNLSTAEMVLNVFILVET